MQNVCSTISCTVCLKKCLQKVWFSCYVRGYILQYIKNIQYISLLKVMGTKPFIAGLTPEMYILAELVATIKCIRLMVISHNVAATALMWKAAGGVKVGSSPLEAALPTWASQRKSVHSFWKVPSGARAWMVTTAKTLPPYHMLHDLRGNTHTHTHLGLHLSKTVWLVDGYRSQNSSSLSLLPLSIPPLFSQ